MFYSADGVSGWSQTSKLIASDKNIYEYFGTATAVYGSVVVVSAYTDDNSLGSASGVQECVCPVL